MAVFGRIPGVVVVGGGTAFPTAHTLDNRAVLRLLAPDLDEERARFQADGVKQTLGVDKRAWSHVPGTAFDHSREENAIDLAVRATQAALADAKLSAGAVDALLVATSTPPRWTSTVSAQVAARTGIASALCNDIRAGCASGIAAFYDGCALLEKGARNVVVVGTETFSKVIPPGHKMATLTLADGAAALVITRGEDERSRARGVESCAFLTDGAKGGLVNVPGALPPIASDVDAGRFVLDGEVAGLEDAIPAFYARVIGDALLHAKLSGSDVDLYIPHQTARPLIEKVVSAAGIDASRAWIAVGRHANVGAAGWMVALVEAMHEALPWGEDRAAAGLGAPPMKLLFASVGGGMSAGALVFTW